METELKYALERPQYLRLLRLARGKALRQSNTYFDTPQRTLHRTRVGLRVRIENNRRATLTLKTAPETSTRSGLHRRREWEQPIPLAQARILLKGGPWSKIPGPVPRALRGLFPQLVAADTLAPLGTLGTERHLLKIGSYAAELDRWCVGRRVFYELEVESDAPEQARVACEAYLHAHSIRPVPRATSKLETFFALTSRRKR